MGTTILEQQSGAHLSGPFLDRVRRSYKLALGASNTRHGRMWDNIDERRASVHAALLAKADDDLRNIFADPLSTDLFYGCDNLCQSMLGGNFDDPGIVNYYSDVARSDLFFLAQALKIDKGDLASFDHENALRDADQLLNQAILFPTLFRGELGLRTTRGIASYRAIQAVYQTWRTLSLLTDCDQKSVIEIGPGMGRTAYYAYRAGLTDYTTVDLPMGMVAQACFLGAALGPEKIWMPGDNDALAEGQMPYF